jgi:multidrug efflux pump subunit AcrA (membrane-fusion protein)
VAGFYHLKTRPKSEAIQIQEQTWRVNVISVTPTTLAPTVTLYGRVESPRTATLRTPPQSFSANGEVLEVAVLEGELVKKGQLLVRLDDRDGQLNLQQRESDVTDIEAEVDNEKIRHANDLASIAHEEALLKLAQRGVERAKKLVAQQVGAESALDQAQQSVEQQMLSVNTRNLSIKSHRSRLAQLEAKLSRAVALRDMARLELERTKVTAPFTGIVTQVTVAIGDRVRSGDALLSLYDHTVLEVRSQIPSRYQSIVLATLTTKYRLQSLAQVDEHTIRLQLERVAGQIDKDHGGIDALFRLVEGGAFLRLGQFLTLSLILPQQANVIALPFEAVYETGRIYKLVDGRMKGLAIERVGEQTLPNGKSQILVRSPELQTHDQVIVTQLPNAVEGLKVSVK